MFNAPDAPTLSRPPARTPAPRQRTEATGSRPSLITAEVVIDRDPAAVFEFVANLDKRRHWRDSLVSVERLTDGPDGLGTSWVESFKLGPQTYRAEMTNTEFEPGRHFTETVRSALGNGTINLAFIAEGSTTRLRVSTQMEWLGLWRLLRPFLERVSTRGLDGDLGRIKQQLEAAA